MRNKAVYVMAAFLAVILVSCSSTKQFERQINFTGMILDENNKPVPDFYVTVSINNVNHGTWITNDNGVFVCKDAKTGKVQVSGTKEGYAKLSSKTDFLSPERITCFRVYTADAVLDSTEQSISLKDYKEATRKLNTISSRMMTPLRDVISFYKKEIARMKHEKI